MEAHFDNRLTSLISFSQVLGHEAVGVIEQVGPGVRRRQVDERVVLNPWLACTADGVVGRESSLSDLLGRAARAGLAASPSG